MRRMLPCLAFIFAVCGCSEKSATFHGKVTYKGKPLTSGVIFFLGPDMQMGMGTIIEDGTYTATDVPHGDVKVAFQSPGVTEPYTDTNKTPLVYPITPKTKSLDINVP